MAPPKVSGIVFFVLIGVAFGSECSNENRVNNLNGCLAKIKEIMNSKDRFWFGSDYKSNCPQGPAGGILCSNPLPVKGPSIVSRILPSGLEESLLTKYLNIRFTSNPGEYTGCGNSFISTETLVYDIDPTSTLIVTPWNVRDKPEMTWDADDGEYYSIYVYDVGYLKTHAVYINIQGNNITSSGENVRQFVIISNNLFSLGVRLTPEMTWVGEFYSIYVCDVGYLKTHAVYINIQGNNITSSGENVIHAYNGPRIAVNLENPYIFMLFQQSGYLEPKIAMDWYTAAHSGITTSSHIPGFISTLNMTGPIAINWIVATGDEYAAEIAYNSGEIVTCPIFIGKALDMKPRPFLPSQSELTVMLKVIFFTPELHISLCCKNYNIPNRNLILNPIGNERIDSAYTRPNSFSFPIVFEKMGYFADRYDLRGNIFTVIALDPDVPDTMGNETHPYLYLMKINIMYGYYDSGETVLDWFGAYPITGEQYCYFLVYKHTAPVNRTRMLSYSGASNCNERCAFDIESAVRENNLTLVGASWFRSVQDIYMLYRDIQNERTGPEEVACLRRSDYPAACTAGIPTLYFNNVDMVLAMLFSVLFNAFVR